MDRPGGTILRVCSVVGAGPAIQRRSVMHYRRLISRGLVLLSIVSLILLIAVTALWVRSYFVKDDILFPRPDGSRRTIGIKTYPGTIDVDVIRMTVAVTDPPRWDRSEVDAYDRKRSREWDKKNSILGFAQVRTNFGGQHPVLKKHYAGYHSEWFVPFWSLAFVALLSPIVLILSSIRRRRRRNKGLCPQCGYDLRATPDRCPECGTPRPASTSSTRHDQWHGGNA